MIQDCYEKLQDFFVQVSNTYGHTSKSAKAAKKAVDDIAELKDQMDDLVFRENPQARFKEKSTAYYAHSRRHESEETTPNS
jgi:hypothetical protein